MLAAQGNQNLRRPNVVFDAFPTFGMLLGGGPTIGIWSVRHRDRPFYVPSHGNYCICSHAWSGTIFKLQARQLPTCLQ